MKEGKTRRVLMTADTVGGVWTYALELIRAFEPFEVQVLLATMGRPLSSQQWEEVRSIGTVAVEESNYKLEWMDDPWEHVRASGEWLHALEAEFHPDVIHLNGYAHAAMRWSAPILVAGHSCVSSWWRAVKGEAIPASWARYCSEVANGLQAADLVVTPTKAMLDCLLENYGPLRSSMVIPNGRAAGTFKPKQKENFVLSAGRLWDEAKNVRAVCACSLELNWPVLVAGETAFDGCSAADTPGPNLRLLGRLSAPEMIDLMGRASIFAHPAKYEPFGLGVLEAALSECALVLSDIPSLRENWNGAALFVDPVNHGQIRDAISGLIRRPILRRELGRAASERAKRFNIQFTAMRYLEAYESLLAAKSNSAVEEELASV